MTRARHYLAMALIVGAFAANNLIYNPIGQSVPSPPSPVWEGVTIARLGAIIAQPLLLALLAVLWPASRPARLIASLALFVLVVESVLAADASSGNRVDSLAAAFFALEYVILLVVCYLAARWRQWRLVGPLSDPGAVTDHRFTLRGLLVTIGLTGVLLALGRWVFAGRELSPLVPRIWSEMGAMLLIFTVHLLPAVLLVPLILDSTRRARTVKWFLVLVSISTLGGLLFLTYTGPNEPWQEFARQMGSMLVGMYGSVLLTLVVLRRCGFRLESHRIELVTPRDNATARGPSFESSTRAGY